MFQFDFTRFVEICMEYRFWEKICENWNNRREEEGRGGYENDEIVIRRLCDIVILQNIKENYFNKTNKNQNNIILDSKVDNDISDRAKRMRRANIRKKLVSQKPVLVLESQNNPTDYTNVEENVNNNNFKEQITSDEMLIDRIVIRSPRKNFNLNKIKELPKSGAYSVLTKGEFMFINIDCEKICKYLPVYFSIWNVLSGLNDNNFFSENISEILSKSNSNNEEKKSAIEKLFNDNIKFHLWGFEIAFDFANKTANDLIAVNNFRKYAKKVSKTGLPTYYSKESDDNSLLIVYDRKEKLKKQGVYVENENLTRFEIKYYGTYMDSPTFKPDLSNWLNEMPISLSYRNSQTIAKAIYHATGGENNFVKMQNYIENKPQFMLLNWILKYSFPEINR
ncbi:MAG TPA: hypothetical protein PK771_02925 [Spirochaetota bacterium]|nr:hypothetical protein [Spirochaetota bacterium]